MDSQGLRKPLYVRLLLRLILLTACVLFVIYAMPFLFSLAAPFVFAFLMALTLNPLVSFLNRKFGLPRKVSAFILVILLFISLVSLIGWAIYRAITEMVSLAMDFQIIWESITTAFNYMNLRLEWLLAFLPDEMEAVMSSGLEGIYQWLRAVSLDFVNMVVTQTPSFTSKVGGLLLGMVISLLAAYFMTAEYRPMGALIQEHLGKRIYGYYEILLDASVSAMGGYLKAQLLLALLALIVMFPALLIYGQRYAFLIAVFLSMIDFLPIIGTSALLLPWGFVELAMGNIIKSVFLFALAGVFFVLRKLVEPKVVGSQIGLHPLIALVSMFVGLRLFGIWGAVFSPIVVMIGINIAKSHMFDNTVLDVMDAWNDINRFIHRDEISDDEE